MRGWLIDTWRLFLAKLANAHKSLTIWFNGLTGSLVIMLPYLQDNIPQLAPFLSENTFRYVMGGIVLANIILRFNVTKCLSKK